MNYTETIIEYKKAGLCCLPTKADKSPDSSKPWKDGFDVSEFEGSHGVGIICGDKSGGLECLDFDNHQADAYNNLTAFIESKEVNELYTKYKFPIERSMSGGYHLMFRCSHNDGNRKLASRMFNGKPDCFIETRGEGGYFVSSPTPGYTVLRNDILNIPTISLLERATLIDTACSFNEYVQNVYTSEFENGDRPGDLYNQSMSSGQETINLLLIAGWQQIGDYKWRRPDKKEGISATFGKVAPNIFYCFTSNAHPFEPMRAYTPFQVLALLKYEGNFKEAAKAIAPEHVEVKTRGTELNPTEIEKILNKSKIDTTKRVERPPVILSIIEQSASQTIKKRLFTLGNFSCIVGKAKSRKTYLLSLLTASVLNSDSNSKFKSELPHTKSDVLYFDTEQGEYDAYNVVKRIETLSGTSTMRSFMLREYSPRERCSIIEHAFKLWGNTVSFCVIDGVADLAFAINDEEEASRVTTMLLRLTKQYNCHISTVIHQNKNDNFATGHLGSSIMKKAEILISVAKAKDSQHLSDVSCDLNRGVDFEPFCFDVDLDGLPRISGEQVQQLNGSYAPAFSGNSLPLLDRNDVPF